MRKLISFFLTFMVLASLCVTATASEPIDIKITVAFGQTEARKMLEIINDFRTGEDAWYVNQDGTRHDCPGLSELIYDYELEETAMQRAAEIALYFDHDRPDGSDCFLIYPEGLSSSCGENIACGGLLPSAEAAFYAWREDDLPYSAQGHRRNMLHSGLTHIGIGHVIVGRSHFWVQVFKNRRSTPVTTPTSAENSTREMTIPVDPDLVQDVYDRKITMEIGESMPMPEVYFDMGTSSFPYRPADAANMPVWSVSDLEKLNFDGTTITALKKGEVTMNTTVFGKPSETRITIKGKDISSAEITVADNGLVYNGSAQTPEVSVNCGETKLTKDTDFTVSYQNNTAASDAAKVIITGTGNYEGTAEKTFMIKKAALTVTANDKSITYGDAPSNAGVSYTGFVGGEDAGVLKGKLSYDYSCVRYGDAGEYIITPSGLSADNYQISFVNGKLTVAKKEVTILWDNTSLTYNGEKQSPTATITGTVNGDSISAVVTEGQINAGSYTASVTALSGEKAGNYQLPAATSVEYVIAKAAPVVTAPKAKTGLVASGSAQELVTAGSAVGGTTQYALGENESTAPVEDYAAIVPSGTNVGTYYVWYKVLGDENHTDTVPACIQVKISATEEAQQEQEQQEQQQPQPEQPEQPEMPSDPVVLPSETTVSGGVFALNNESHTAAYSGTEDEYASSVIIPATIFVSGTTYQVTEIKNAAFQDMTALQKVEIGKNVTSIGKNAFSGCVNLQIVTFKGKKVSSIGDSAFRKCISLESLTIPKGVKTIGKNAFNGCKKLSKITVKTTALRNIGKKAFSGIDTKAVFKCPKKLLDTYAAMFRKAGAPKKAQYK